MLVVCHYCFRWWFGAKEATSHYLNQWWFIVNYWDRNVVILIKSSSLAALEVVKFTSSSNKNFCQNDDISISVLGPIGKTFSEIQFKIKKNLSRQHIFKCHLDYTCHFIQASIYQTYYHTWLVTEVIVKHFLPNWSPNEFSKATYCSHSYSNGISESPGLSGLTLWPQ